MNKLLSQTRIIITNEDNNKWLFQGWDFRIKCKWAQVTVEVVMNIRL